MKRDENETLCWIMIWGWMRWKQSLAFNNDDGKNCTKKKQSTNLFTKKNKNFNLLPIPPVSFRPCPCVTAAGLRAGNTWFTFMLAGIGSNRCTRQVIMATRSSITVMNTISTLMGRHALASPKGGGPCSLGTFNYGVASHLAFRLI